MTIIVRWICALVAAVLVYGAVFAAGGQVPKYVAIEPSTVLHGSAFFATALAMYVGCSVAPRTQWRAAMWVIFCLALLPPIVLFATASLSGFTTVSLRLFGSVLVGGFAAMFALPKKFGPAALTG